MVIEEQVRIRVIRAIIGWDMKKIAARLDVNPNTVTNWERGRSVPNSSNRRVLAEICQENNIGFRPDGYPVLEG